MKKIMFWPLICIGILCMLLSVSAYAEKPVQYYFKTLDVRNGLSQNTVFQILQDRMGFMWFGTREGLNRYDGLSFRVYKKENSALGRNFITALYEDEQGNIWVGTDDGLYIYNPELDSFRKFDIFSDKNSCIMNYITQIESDEEHNIWIASEEQGLFCYEPASGQLRHCLDTSGKPNINRFWIRGDMCWVNLYTDNLYYTTKDLSSLSRYLKMLMA